MIHVIKLSLELSNLHVIVYVHMPHTRNMGKTYWYSFPIPWNKKSLEATYQTARRNFYIILASWIFLFITFIHTE